MKAGKEKRKSSSSESAPLKLAENSATARRTQWIAVAVALFSWLAVYLARLDRVVGLVIDDAWYVMLAKAIATGQGYTLINSPFPNLAPVYPPFYPFLLSLVWRVMPAFPQNIIALKSVASLALLGVGVITFYWLRRQRDWPFWLSLLTALTATLTPGLVFLATSTAMSECVFALCFVAGIVLTEQALGQTDNKRQYLYLASGAAVAAAGFLTRSIGISLIVAAVIYFLQKRRWPLAALYVLVVGLLIAPWLLYARSHAPTVEQRRLQGGMILSGYSTQFWQQRAGKNEAGEIEARELPSRLWNNIASISGQDPAMLYAPLLYRSSKLSGEETLEGGGNQKLLAFLLSGLILLGLVLSVSRRFALPELAVVIYIAVTIAWPWATFRFMLPLAPFWLYYLLSGVRGLLDYQKNLTQSLRWRVLTAVAGGVLLLYLVDHALYLKARGDLTAAEALPWQAIYNEHQAALEWINKRTLNDAVIATSNPALVHLYTGRKTVFFEFPARNWEDWKRLNVRYLAHLTVKPVADPSMIEGRFDQAYRSTGPLKLRVVNLGPPEKRINWDLHNVPGNIKIDTRQ